MTSGSCVQSFVLAVTRKVTSISRVSARTRRSLDLSRRLPVRATRETGSGAHAAWGSWGSSVIPSRLYRVAAQQIISTLHDKNFRSCIGNTLCDSAERDAPTDYLVDAGIPAKLLDQKCRAVRCIQPAWRCCRSRLCLVKLALQANTFLAQGVANQQGKEFGECKFALINQSFAVMLQWEHGCRG